MLGSRWLGPLLVETVTGLGSLGHDIDRNAVRDAWSRTVRYPSTAGPWPSDVAGRAMTDVDIAAVHLVGEQTELVAVFADGLPYGWAEHGTPSFTYLTEQPYEALGHVGAGLDDLRVGDGWKHHLSCGGGR